MYPDYEQEPSTLDNILTGTIASAAAGSALSAGIIAERARRRANTTGQSYRDALIEVGVDMADDAASAIRVIKGATPYDEMERDPNGSSKYVSMREYAQAQPYGEVFSTQAPTSGSYVKNPLTQLAVSARDAFVPSSEDFLGFRREERLKRGVSPEGPKADTVLNRIPLVDAYRDLAPRAFGGFSDDERVHRAASGIDLMKGNSMQALGGALGRSGADFVNNGLRSVWWLLNAPQAVADVAAEQVSSIANREGLYGLDYALENEAKKLGWIDSKGRPKNSSINPVRFDRKIPERNDPQLQRRVDDLRAQGGSGKKLYSRRRVGANLSTLLAAPAAIAINSGLGLNNPFGGDDGRKAVFGSEEDPTKTDNVIAEVAAKYILGRQGDLLPWDEYKKVRPDVTKDEYMAYKAYRHSKAPDYNILDDGDINILNGVIKATDDGLDGGEVMFLGRSMPIATTIAPTVAGVLGAGLGSALSQYGGLNIDGVTEGIARRQTEIESIEKDLGSMKADDSKRATREKRINQLNKEISRKTGLLNQMQTGPLSPVFTNPRVRRGGVIAAGLGTGLAATGITSLVGNELERRRREYEAERGI